MFQQGDVILIPNKIPKGFIETETDILQHGEATGHAHRLHGDGFRVFVDKHDARRKFIRLVKPTPLRHEEHKEIKLPEGEYEVRIVREYNHFDEEAKNVVD